MATIEDKAKALQKSKAEEFASACPSRVIEMALEDLEAVEQTPGYVIDMDLWHSPRRDGAQRHCMVCLAGSVIANRFGADKNVSYCPEDFNYVCSGQIMGPLLALDCFRCGFVQDGLDYMGLPWPFSENELPAEMDIPEYADDPAFFKTEMLSMVALLKSHGL